MDKMDSLDRMSATWECEICGMIRQWSYWNLISLGCPICPACYNDMFCHIHSGKIDLT